MKILLTGSDGYIGSGLVEKFTSLGHSVECVDLSIFFKLENTIDNPFNRPRDNIKDVDATVLKGVDHVIHLAAISNDPSAELDGRLTWETNVLYTLRLIEASVSAGVPHFTFASSGSVYGLKSEEKVTEDLSLVPMTDYNKSKMCAERILLSYGRDIGLTIVRPATVCGVSKRQRLDVVVNILTYQALKTGKINLFGGDQVRPHIHINDMHRLYIDIIDHPNRYQGIFNAGFENLTNRELAERIASSTNAKIVTTKSDDNRSYRLCSDKILRAGFEPKFSVADAVSDIMTAYNSGVLKDGPETRSVEWLRQNYGK